MRLVLGVLRKDWCWSWSSSILATWYEELTHWKKPWCWERLRAGGEGDDRGWDGWMASSTRWTWVWVNSGSCWWTGRPGMLQFMGSQRIGHYWVTELNLSEVWTNLKMGNSWSYILGWGKWGAHFHEFYTQDLYQILTIKEPRLEEGIWNWISVIKHVTNSNFQSANRQDLTLHTMIILLPSQPLWIKLPIKTAVSPFEYHNIINIANIIV